MSDAITEIRKPRAKGSGSSPWIRCFWCRLFMILLLFFTAACLENLFWDGSRGPLSYLKSLIPPLPTLFTPAPSSPPSAPVSSPPPSAPVSSPPSASLLSKQPIPQPTGEEVNLRNAYFDINTPVDELEVRICVRDHECEDGDIIRLFVNRSEVYRGEIFTTPSCVIVPVQSGENDLRLYAINGTGGKGNCAYQQINTGQIIIQSINWESAKWGLSPGEANSVKVNITPK